MEYVGSNNEPKAEMHPGQKLTGPKEEEEKATGLLCRTPMSNKKVHRSHSSSMVSENSA
jgi:hypothetical protein